MNRRGARWAGALCAAALACCGAESPAPAATRAERYGIFRDLVWFAPGEGRASGFFLDLFESTQEDWRAFAAARGEPAAQTDAFVAGWAVAGGVDPALPVVGVDLAEARAFARWRFGRVPRLDELEFAATARGCYLLPWGDLPRPAYANTVELRHHALTPVGTFESGRQVGGPYDLIGNAAEWTESVEFDWSGGPANDFIDRARTVALHPALAPHWACAVPVPASPQLRVREHMIPHRVVGGADRPMLTTPGRWSTVPAPMLPRERSSWVGVRVASDPPGIVRSLLAEDEAPTPAAAAQLRAFLRRHRAVLLASWRGVAEGARGPVAAILREELGS